MSIYLEGLVFRETEIRVKTLSFLGKLRDLASLINLSCILFSPSNLVSSNGKTSAFTLTLYFI